MILHGRVASLGRQRIAEEDAWNVAGVGWLASRLEAGILREIRSASPTSIRRIRPSGIPAASIS